MVEKKFSGRNMLAPSGCSPGKETNSMGSTAAQKMAKTAFRYPLRTSQMAFPRTLCPIRFAFQVDVEDGFCQR
jgi:hypothetical protein